MHAIFHTNTVFHDLVSREVHANFCTKTVFNDLVSYASRLPFLLLLLLAHGK